MLKMFPTSWKAVKKMLEISGIPEKLEELQQLYAGLSEKNAMKSLGTDMAFWKDHIKCTQAQVGNGRVYCYRFDFTTLLLKLAGMGAMHGSDIGPALDTYEGGLSKITRFSSKKRNESIHSMMHGAWVSFAKTGDPNGSHLPIRWNEYNLDNKETFIFDDLCSTENAPKTEAFRVWKDINVYSK